VDCIRKLETISSSLCSLALLIDNEYTAFSQPTESPEGSQPNSGEMYNEAKKGTTFPI
jgi:hypothetical protein